MVRFVRWAGLAWVALWTFSLAGQEAVDFVCPMDPDVHSTKPGACPRCKMRLVAGLPEPLEYPVHLTVSPKPIAVGAPTTLQFRVDHPTTGERVRRFDEIHEKRFHLFLISEDLGHFAHEHPEVLPDGTFRFTGSFPRPGLYRLLTDFYPTGGTPQMVAKSLYVGGPGNGPQLQPSLAAQHGENLSVSLRMESAEPLAGQKTLLFFTLSPGTGLQPYLGAWAHMLAASSDLVDLIHQHPAIAEGGPTVQFNVIFPRPGLHKLWVQFQREGVVNTVAFVVPVKSL